jgi:hypothetical protein
MRLRKGKVNSLASISKEQLNQAEAIINADLSLKGAIRAWSCGIHGQQKLSYSVNDGKVTVKCLLCDASNNWGLPEKQEKAKTCVVCDSTLTEKEAKNPEQICDECLSIGDVKAPEESENQKET